MSSTDPIQPDPFRDPSAVSAESSEGEFAEEDTTLLVGRNASLTLGTDSLIVLGECDDEPDERMLTGLKMRDFRSETRDAAG
jgi:hypothetical protein